MVPVAAAGDGARLAVRRPASHTREMPELLLHLCARRAARRHISDGESAMGTVVAGIQLGWGWVDCFFYFFWKGSLVFIVF